MTHKKCTLNGAECRVYQIDGVEYLLTDETSGSSSVAVRDRKNARVAIVRGAEFETDEAAIAWVQNGQFRTLADCLHGEAAQ